MSTKTNKKGLQTYTSHPWELAKTFFLVVTWIILGIHLELVGPTLDILARQTQVTYTGISNILLARGAGYMAGNLGGASLQNIVKRHSEGLVSVAFLIASIVVLATPAIYNLYLLCVVFFIQGVSQGITDLGGTSLILTMWGDDASAPLNLVHLGYGFGAVIANFLVKPFISKREVPNNLPDHSTNASITIEASDIRTPYSITAFLCLLIAIGHLIFAIREHRIRREALRNRQINYATVSTSIVNETAENKVKNESQYSPRSCGNGHFVYGLSMSMVWILYMFFVSGNDLTFGKFFFAFLKTPEYGITTTGATWGMIIYWFSYSIGRFVCAIVTVALPVYLALCALWISGFLLAIVWYIFVWVVGLTSTNLFVLGALTGFVFSPTFPLSFGFINQRLNVKPILVALLLCGSALGGMSFQKLAGIVLDENRKHFPTLLITCVILSITFFVIALVISTTHQRRLNSKQNPNTNIDNKHISNISEEEQQMETYLAKN